MANVILWRVVGGVAGIITKFIEGAHSPRGMASNVIVGVIGGIVGGFFFSLVFTDGGNIVSAFDPRSAFAALVAAAILPGLSYATSRIAALACAHGRHPSSGTAFALWYL